MWTEIEQWGGLMPQRREQLPGIKDSQLPFAYWYKRICIYDDNSLVWKTANTDTTVRFSWLSISRPRDPPPSALADLFFCVEFGSRKWIFNV